MFKKFLCIITSIIISISLSFTGCTTMPTPAAIETSSYAIGTSAALVCNISKIEDQNRQIISEIITEIKYYTPTSGSDLVSSWNKIATNHTNKLVSENKITQDQSKLILQIFSTVVNSADYMVRIRYPKIGEYQELIIAATQGFCNGFLSAFNSSTSLKMSAALDAALNKKKEYDAEAYNYLLKLKIENK